MDSRIDVLNRRQLGSKKPLINRERTHFEWEDTTLLPLLCNGLPHLYPRTVSKENQRAEEEAICIVNQLVERFINNLEYLKLEEELDAAITSQDGYVASRLTELKNIVIGEAKTRKGLLVYGEGGIGKTYFLYELAQQLSSKHLPYAIAFNQEGVMKLDEIGIQNLKNSFPNGFMLIIDACNELDDDIFETACNLIEATLQVANASVVVTTRSESPTSRMNELKTILPISLKFQGVNPDLVFSAITECSDEIIIQYQDMLFSKNPRNLNAMLGMLQEFRPGEDGRKATTQRTALIEKSIKDSLNKHHWKQTKDICSFLLDSNNIGFSERDAENILGKESNAYLSNMIEQGFIERYEHDGLRYYFSSESQIRFVVARCLNKSFDELISHNQNEDELINNIVVLVSEKSSYSNECEMIQVAIDRFIDRGPAFLAKLFDRLIKSDMKPDWERLLTQTIFPLNWDFNRFTDFYEDNYDWAFLNFSGLLNTPFNLTNYLNNYFLANTSLVDSFFIKKWERWELGSLITRVQGITEFVSRSKRVPAAARIEWVWLSIWCSYSSDMMLRSLSQRLMFFLCDSDNEALQEIILAWSKVQDIYARRAIIKAISHLDKNTRATNIVKEFILEIVEDSDVRDSIIIATACRAFEEQITPLDFCAKNLYLELVDYEPTQDELDNFKCHAGLLDIIHKDFLPFDIYQMQKGYLDFSYSQKFISTPVTTIKDWNDSLQNLLGCQQGGECQGWLISENELPDNLPIEFKREPLNRQRIMNCMVFLVKSWFERYGGDLQNLLGEFKPLNPYKEKYITPNMKLFDLASHELLGSLASNYYIDEIIVGGNGYNLCGFCQYNEEGYKEPGTIHTPSSVSNDIIDLAKPKLERRIVSPEDKEPEWFNDKDEVFSEILELASSIRIGKIDWQPIAFSARKKIQINNNLACSNEFMMSIAFRSEQHINGSRNDRYLTIEHKEFTGNMRDYKMAEGSECLLLDAPDIHCTFTERNSILLPPPSLIKHLNLSFNSRNACFVGKSSEDVVIACDGAPGNYYEEPIHNLILMRKDAYDELAQKDTVVFFAFTERFHKDTGYMNNCDRHWEFRSDGLKIGDYSNQNPDELPVTPKFCENCFLSSSKRRERRTKNFSNQELESPIWLKLLDEYKSSED